MFAQAKDQTLNHLWFGFEFGKFPLKTSNFSIFSFRVKKNLFRSHQKVSRSKAGQSLIYCRLKVGLGRVGSCQGLSLPLGGYPETLLSSRHCFKLETIKESCDKFTFSHHSYFSNSLWIHQNEALLWDYLDSIDLWTNHSIEVLWGFFMMNECTKPT